MSLFLPDRPAALQTRPLQNDAVISLSFGQSFNMIKFYYIFFSSSFQVLPLPGGAREASAGTKWPVFPFL